jgi:hypothetical protein
MMCWSPPLRLGVTAALLRALGDCVGGGSAVQFTIKKRAGRVRSNFIKVIFKLPVHCCASMRKPNTLGDIHLFFA